VRVGVTRKVSSIESWEYDLEIAVLRSTLRYMETSSKSYSLELSSELT